jgi:hypothetical protein
MASDPPNAYDLLSKPTNELTDAEVELIVVDLRRRRQLYIATGKPDRGAPAKPKEPKAKPTAADKAANTASLLSKIDWKL